MCRYLATYAFDLWVSLLFRKCIYQTELTKFAYIAYLIWHFLLHVIFFANIYLTIQDLMQVLSIYKPTLNSNLSPNLHRYTANMCCSPDSNLLKAMESYPLSSNLPRAHFITWPWVCGWVADDNDAWCCWGEEREREREKERERERGAGLFSPRQDIQVLGKKWPISFEDL